MGSSVYIVGCGPEGRNGYHKIPRDAEVILCNAAITLADAYGYRDFKWFVSDSNAVETSWFKRWYPYQRYNLFASGQVAEVTPSQREVFEENPWFTWGDLSLIAGVYRGGGSIVGCAMQYIYYKYRSWTEPKIILCGVDMDGKTSLSHRGPVYGDDHWSFKRFVLNHLICDHMPEVAALTRTALKCKRL